MNFDITKRLRRLEAVTSRARKTVFILENGIRFYTEADPLAYLLQHGPESPQGRIIGYEHTEGRDVDPISRSMYEYLDELISS